MKENELKEKTSEELLFRYSMYKMFQGDATSGHSPLAGDVEKECELIHKILLERLNGKEVK